MVLGAYSIPPTSIVAMLALLTSVALVALAFHTARRTHRHLRKLEDPEAASGPDRGRA